MKKIVALSLLALLATATIATYSHPAQAKVVPFLRLSPP
jgi:hypothetical protein